MNDKVKAWTPHKKNYHIYALDKVDNLCHSENILCNDLGFDIRLQSDQNIFFIWCPCLGNDR